MASHSRHRGRRGAHRAQEPATGGGDQGGAVAVAEPAGRPAVPDDGHLRPFTSTAEVPRVTALPPGADPRFTPTGMYPVVWARPLRPAAPLWLVFMVWFVAVLLVLGVAGLLVHSVRPSWLRSLEVDSQAASPNASATGTSAPTGHQSGVVAQKSTGPASADVTVRAGRYTVLVSTQAPCWVQVNSPAAFAPVFAAVVPAGTQKTFDSSNGQLTVQLGASKVAVQVRIDGRVVQGWRFTPSATPFVLNFSSTS